MESLTKQSVFEFCWSSLVDEHNSIPKSTRRHIYIWLPDLLCRHWFASSVWNYCHWVADVPPRETSPATKSEEKRMFSQARKDLTPKQQLKMFTCFILPSFKASVTSKRPFWLAFTFFRVSIAHLRNLVQNTAYFDTVSSVALPLAWQLFLFFSGHCSGTR